MLRLRRRGGTPDPCHTQLKLLFDQNLSRHLVSEFVDDFPGSGHVLMLGLATASDQAVWQFAGAQDFIVVSKDDDFNDLARLLGPPPKVIHIALGNSTTEDVAKTIRASLDAIHDFGASDEALLVVGAAE